MEQKLQSTMRELAAIKQALDEAAIVAITDRRGTITHVNEKFCKISKYSREELLGQNHRIIKSGRHPQEFYIDLWKTISSGKVWEGEICNRAKDGSFYWVNTCIVPFLDENERPYQYVSIRYEITQRKDAEEKLVSYSKKLEQSNTELEQFASIAAHDLQEPLRKIQAFSDRLITKFGQTIPEEGQVYLQRMQDAAGRMQTLINDLLIFSRVKTKKNPYANVDLKKTLADVTSDLVIPIEKSGAKIVIDDLPTIQADGSQMHQLFMNLVANAIKFRKADRPCEVKVTCETNGSTCVIKVRDNGIGFDEKYIDRIFNIFQRLHGRGEYPGTGIGLAVCRRITDRHGGTITASSRLDEGSTFLVTLPISQNTEEWNV